MQNINKVYIEFKNVNIYNELGKSNMRGMIL